MEHYVTEGSTKMAISATKLNVLDEEADVKWNLIGNGALVVDNGTFHFNSDEIQKVLKIDIANETDLPYKMELYEPSDGFYLGETTITYLASVGNLLKHKEPSTCILILLFADCCTTLNVTISSGKAEELYGDWSGIYTMYTGFANAERFWVSSTKENAIWFATGDVKFWAIHYTSNLGTAFAKMYLPIQDPSLECPHSLGSNWKYSNNGYFEDVNKTISVECVDFDW